MKIAAGCIDPVGSKLAALYPDPNDPHVPVWTGATNYNFVYDSPTQNNSGDVRIDHKLRTNDSIFGRYSILHQHRQDPPWTSNFVAGNGGFATDYVIHNQGLALGWTHIFSTTAVNQARYGFLRDNAHSNPIGVTLGTSNAADYGLTGIPASPFTAGLPPLYISGLVTLGTDRFRPQFQVSQVFQFIDNFTKLTGTHSLMFGYQYHRNTDTFLDLQAPQGYMQTSPGFTRISRDSVLLTFYSVMLPPPSTTRRSMFINSCPVTRFSVRTPGAWQGTSRSTMGFGMSFMHRC